MKAQRALIILIVTIILTGHAMAAVTVGTYDVTGSWTEFLTGGQGGQAGNHINAIGPDWFLAAELVPPPNPASAPWTWQTTYNNAFLGLGPAGPWNDGASASGFALQVLSTGYDQASGTLAWEMTGSGVLDTGNPFTVSATYASPANPGIPTLAPTTGGVDMQGVLSSAQIGIQPMNTTNSVPAPEPIPSPVLIADPLIWRAGETPLTGPRGDHQSRNYKHLRHFCNLHNGVGALRKTH